MAETPKWVVVNGEPVREERPPNRGLVVFSGGSAANNLVDIFADMSKKRNCDLSYVIPISDNGGSTSEIIRVFGGPGIGDIRSRLVRLIPESHQHIYAVLNHRLPVDDAAAHADWLQLVEGTSPLWEPIAGPQRELLRSMLNHVNFEIVKRARPPRSTFNFSKASVGNLFLTGARIFTGSFESAIYLLAIVGSIPATVSVIPAINSNFAHHISAELQTGEVITGQNSISHPSEAAAIPGLDSSFWDHPEDANLPGSLPTLRQQNISFTKAQEDDLPASIKRVRYINPYGEPMHVPANPKVLEVTSSSAAVVYSIGSLYTSIIPCLVLGGVGQAIARLPSYCKKILILNGSYDRESGPRAKPMEAADFVKAIARACEESQGRDTEPDDSIWSRYVTHVVYVEGDAVPVVDKARLSAAGVEAVRCWSKRMPDGSARYDLAGLQGAMEAILGNGTPRVLSRRNTVVGH